jgi:hypothetical protein
VGRLDGQVKIQGFRVETGEVEAAIRLHPAARDAVVVAREDESRQRRLVAYVVLMDEHVQATDLRSFLKKSLPPYMIPATFVFLEAFPLTPTGKLDRQALPAPDGNRSTPGDSYVAPRTPFEEALVAIWRDVLGLERIGIHDDFFDLGGHSLLATQVLSRVGRVLQIDLGLRCLFENPTVAGLSLLIVQRLMQESATEEKCIVENETSVRGSECALSAVVE